MSNAHCITADRQHCRVALYFFDQGNSLSNRAHVQQLHHIAHDIRHHHFCNIDRAAARLNLGKVQNVIDDRQQMITITTNGFDVLTSLPGIDPLVTKKLSKPKNRRHRRPDFMGNIGKEVRLRSIRFLRSNP